MASMSPFQGWAVVFVVSVLVATWALRPWRKD
jgi:hypothetical protein